MTSDGYTFGESYGTGDWAHTVNDRITALDRKTGTTNQPADDRLLAVRNSFVQLNAKRYASLVDSAEPRRLPHSVEATLVALAAESAEPGWDGERGRPVDEGAWSDARALLRTLPTAVLEGPDFHVSMSGDGYVHITLWRQGRGRATVEVGHGKYFWGWVRGMDEGADEELSTMNEASAKLTQFIAS